MAKTQKEAFGLLYKKYFQQIFNYCLRRLGDVTTAQEITADTFVDVMKDLAKFNYRGAPFSSWIYRIANNNINSHFRKKKFVFFSQLFKDNEINIPDNQSLEEEILEAEKELNKFNDFKLIQSEILKLDIKYQEVIILRFFENKKLAEIGLILNKNGNTVKSLLKRGVEILKRNLN